MTCIDAYSKFLVVKEIQNKLNIENNVIELLQKFSQAKVLKTENDRALHRTNLNLFLKGSG